MLRALVCALGFLTRIPLPQVALREQDVARSAGFFAWVGALIGGLLWALARGLESLGSHVASIGVIAAWATITGALHLDGLADTVDGVSGGRGDRARTLEIMRDSRIGAHGATALVLLLALKWAALERVFSLGFRDWPLVPLVARFVCTLLLAGFPYARSHGLGSAFVKRVGARELALGALAFVPAVFWLGAAFLPSAALGAAAALSLALWLYKRLGGLTGDVHGAAIEVCEVAMLLGLCSLDLR